MKYSLLYHSTEKKVIGDYPQTAHSENRNSYGDYQPNSRANLTNKSFPKITPDFNLMLDRKAKITDVVSVSNITLSGLFFNNKVKEILSEFRIMEHRIYDGSLIHNGKSTPYYFLHVINNSLEGIDFPKSTFFEANMFGHKQQNVDILDEKDFYLKLNKCEGTNKLNPEKLIFTSHFMKNNYDVLLFPEIHGRLIVSNKVIEAFLNANISGFQSKPITYL